ncbi:NLR family CARD domain-containing protein 3-like [Dysidea avara]|uniref:NLR family CARD domain-containing protein 3-like n=1 Tax=Dysidea avara TaxID=196820 RepID=UPI003327257D
MGIIKVCKTLQKISTLCELYISVNSSMDEAVDDIAAVLSQNYNLEVFFLNGNNLTETGTMKIAKALQSVYTLNQLVLGGNDLLKEVVDDITAVLSHRSSLQMLEVGRLKLHTVVSIKVARDTQNFLAFTQLFVNVSNIPNEIIDYVEAILSHNNNLQLLFDNGNNSPRKRNVQIAGNPHKDHVNNSDRNVEKELLVVVTSKVDIQLIIMLNKDILPVTDTIVNISKEDTLTLTELCIINHEIRNEDASYIAEIISYNNNLQVVSFNGNSLNSTLFMKIAESLQIIPTLIELNVSNNNITEDVAGHIAVALSHNTNLQVLHLGGNNLRATGIIKIATGLKNTFNLQKLDLNSNNATKSAANAIANVLSHNTNLIALNLSGNNLQGSGIIAIAKGLKDTILCWNLS